VAKMNGGLTRQQASDAVSGLGWRYVFNAARASVTVTSLAHAVAVAERAAGAAGADADEHLRIDVRRDQVVLSVQTFATVSTTERDLDVIRRITDAVSELGLRTDPNVATDKAPADRTPADRAPRSVQMLEIAIDALDIAAIRPFWKAVLGYHDETESSGPEDPIADPIGQGPTIWFQQMDAPRPQRNRIHFDISVPHDEAASRINATIAAGGILRYDAEAPAFWVMADAEGNEICICTWQGRDP
jgi:4a-hydroxytetrahydrobiopterin dehydratase